MAKGGVKSESVWDRCSTAHGRGLELTEGFLRSLRTARVFAQKKYFISQKYLTLLRQETSKTFVYLIVERFLRASTQKTKATAQSQNKTEQNCLEPLPASAFQISRDWIKQQPEGKINLQVLATADPSPYSFPWLRRSSWSPPIPIKTT